jgi:hypothetical protein
MGLASVPLIGAAWCRGAKGPRRGLLLALAAALVLALGRHTPAQGLLATLLPPLGALRYPVKAMMAVSLCWALLAGLGVDRWQDPSDVPRGRWRVMVASPAAVLAAAAAAGVVALARAPEAIARVVLRADSPTDRLPALLAPARAGLGLAALAGLLLLALALLRLRPRPAPRALALAAAALSILDLLAAHADLVPTAPRALYTHRPPVLEPARPPDAGRLYAYDDFVPGRSALFLGRPAPFEIDRAPVGWSADAATALSMRLALFPPTAAAWGVPGSFDHDTPGLAPRRAALLRDLLLAVEGTPAHTRLLQLGAVSRAVALHDGGLEGLPRIATADALLPDPVRVFAVPGARPRAYAVEGARVEADDARALRLLADPAFDPVHEVVLAEGTSAAAPSAFEGSARVVEVGADRVDLDVELSAPGHVVLVDAWAPGWRARVDGRAAPVRRANVAFRAVPVEAGRHRVELRYRPWTVWAGLALSGAALLLAALAWARSAAEIVYI